MASTTSEIVRTKTLENGEKLQYSTTNPELVKDALEAQRKGLFLWENESKGIFYRIRFRRKQAAICWSFKIYDSKTAFAAKG